MIAPSDNNTCESTLATPDPDFLVLARYGRVPQVARFAVHGFALQRDDSVVVSTDRGEELATVLQLLPSPKRKVSGEWDVNWTGEVLRLATQDDLTVAAASALAAEVSFPQWLDRASKWKLQLELIDLERTLDERLILYVLNDRGAETTRLALLAAAAGFGVVHVQPVGAEGIVESTGGGCGSGGCGSGGCATH
jgi:hypothetical protein